MASSENGGFTIVPNTLIDDETLTGTEKLILLSLLRFMNKEQKRAWPSISVIAKCAGISRFWAIETLKHLEEKGLIKTDKKWGRGTFYEVLTDKLSLLVNSVDQSTHLTLPVNSVDQYQSTQLTTPVNSVDPTNTNYKNEITNTKDKHDTTPAKIAPKNESNFEADFEKFWSAYPKPKNPDKTPGRQKYIALRKKGVSADDLLRAAQNYAQAMRGTDPRYIKHCKTFLGPSDAWRDYLNEPAQASDELPDAAELFPDLAEWMRRNRGVANGE